MSAPARTTAPAAARAAARTPARTAGPGALGAFVEILALAWRQTIRSKVLIGIGLAVAFATVLAALIHVYADEPAQESYQVLQVILLSTVVVPLIALLLGTGAMATERESGTLSYLFTRPFPRSAVVLGKGVAAVAVANVATLVAVLAVYVASGAPTDGQVLGGLSALMLEATALTAIFVLFGTLLAKSLYLGIAYIVLFEGLLGNAAGQSPYTVTYHARNLLSRWSADALGRTGLLPDFPDTAARSVVMLVAMTLGALVAASAWVETREYGLRDRAKEE